MPRDKPPRHDQPTPHFTLLPAGKLLWRVGRRTGPDGRSAPLFRSAAPDGAPRSVVWGGRFDAGPDEGGFCYAAEDELSALSETLLRDVSWDTSDRQLPHTALADRHLMLLETLRPLWLISLMTLEELAAVRQDTWLIHAEPADYDLTQQWSRWFRRAQPPMPAGRPEASQAPACTAGLIWPSKRNPGGRAILLYQDACENWVVPAGFVRPLDDAPGRSWVGMRMRALHTAIQPVPGAVASPQHV
jgi:hypothetical protein